MGVDGWNTLHIRGPESDLTELETTGLAISNYSDVAMCEIFFGKANVTIQYKTNNYMTVAYNSRNGMFYDYLQKLLEAHPKCWLKNDYRDEDGNGGVWIARYVNGKISVQEHNWSELSIEEIVHCQDFSLNNL